MSPGPRDSPSLARPITLATRVNQHCLLAAGHVFGEIRQWQRSGFLVASDMVLYVFEVEVQPYCAVPGETPFNHFRVEERLVSASVAYACVNVPASIACRSRVRGSRRHLLSQIRDPLLCRSRVRGSLRHSLFQNRDPLLCRSRVRSNLRHSWSLLN